MAPEIRSSGPAFEQAIGVTGAGWERPARPAPPFPMESTALIGFAAVVEAKKNAAPLGAAFWDKNPGDDLLLHGLGHTTIGAAAFHFRVRDGIGWFHSAMVARERVEGRDNRCPFGTRGRAHALISWEVANGLG